MFVYCQVPKIYLIFVFFSFSARIVLELSQHHHRYTLNWKPLLESSVLKDLFTWIGPKHDGDYLGRQCCSLSPVHRCQTACLRAKQYSEDLANECRKSDNMQLFQCLNLIRVAFLLNTRNVITVSWNYLLLLLRFVQQNKEGEECCSLSADSQCRKACSTVYSATATSASGAG